MMLSRIIERLKDMQIVIWDVKVDTVIWCKWTEEKPLDTVYYDEEKDALVFIENNYFPF